MKLSDTFLTSTQNLFARKWRTALNLLGVIVACTMLIMTLAGTRGVADGIHRMIEALDGASRFVVRPNWKTTNEPPPEAYEVKGDMPETRRMRMEERLKDDWLSKNGIVERMTPDVVDELASIDHVVELVPSFYLSCEFLLGGHGSEEMLPGNATPVAVSDESIAQDIVVGNRLLPGDTDGAIIDELFAYMLGFSSDQELDELVGQKITMRFENTGLRDDSFQFLRAMGENAGGDMAEKAQLLVAVQKLVGDLDSTELTASQKEKIRKAFGQLSGNGKSAESRSVNENPAQSNARFLSKELVIKGVIQESRREGIEGLLRLARGHSTSAILIHPQMASEIRTTLKRNRISRATGTADNIENLEAVVDEIVSRGFIVNSIAHMIGRINRHINRILIALSILAGIILLVAALTISNTLTISVIERTPEFGIMKAMGARDRDILSMMLCEGAMTGIIGAVIATFVSFGLASVIGYFVREYVESQIGDIFAGEIFRFTFWDVVLAGLIGCTVCTLASVLPALRAARLDPIVAMRRK